MLLLAICNQQSIALTKNRHTYWFVTTSTEGRSGYTAKRLSVVAKTLRIMQLTAGLLLVFSLSLSARSVSQTVSFSGKDVPMETVFSAIEQQTGFHVIGKLETLKRSGSVSIQVENMQLDEFLTLLLEGKPYEFEIKSKTIFIKRKSPAADLSPRLDLDTPPITGKVTDAQGKPLAGATVRIKGKNIQTVTNETGAFILQGEKGQTIIVSYVGFDQLEYKIGESAQLNLQMQLSQESLDTTTISVNTGYQRIRRKEQPALSHLSIINCLINV